MRYQKQTKDKKRGFQKSGSQSPLATTTAKELFARNPSFLKKGGEGNVMSKKEPASSHEKNHLRTSGLGKGSKKISDNEIEKNSRQLVAADTGSKRR